MSADNGIYIAKFPDGYRICHGSAIENIDYYPVGSFQRREQLRNYFRESNLYLDKNLAILDAHKMAENEPILEYGVCYLGEYESFIEQC